MRDDRTNSDAAFHETLIHDTVLLFAALILLLLGLLGATAFASPPRHIDLTSYRIAN